MRTIIFSIACVILLLHIPAAGHCNYAIHLKNGGRFLTPHYWEQGQEILFYTTTGVLGVEKQTVRKIERTDEDLRLEPADAALEDTAEGVQPEEEETVDIEAYRDAKDQMVTELDLIAERMRTATRMGDAEGAARLREEMRDKSAQIYGLTDEVTEKNRGELPEGWWDRP